MITTLLRRDPALAFNALMFRCMFPLSIAAVNWWATSRSSHAYTSDTQNIAFFMAFAIGTMLLWLATIGRFCQGRIRVFEYQLALPISARKLVGLRLAAHFLPGLVLFAALLMFVAPSASIDSRLMLRFAACCSAWTFSVLLLFAWRPNQPRIDSSKVYALLVIFGGLVLILPFFAPRLALLLTLPGGAWLMIRLWRQVPKAMCLTGDQISGSPRSAAREQSGSLNLWIARQTLIRPRSLFIALGLFYFAISAQWTITNLLVQLFLAATFAIMMFQISARILRELGHLPISRRTLGAWILLPSAIILLVGTFVGHMIEGSWSTWEFRRKVSLSLETPDEESWLDYQTWHVQVPGELLRFHWGKEPVSIESPEGEIATLEPQSLLWGFPLRLVNPYDVDNESSAEFIAWQLSRAVHGAYGITVSPESFQIRYMYGKSFNSSRFGKDYPAAKARVYPVGQLALGLCLNTLLWTLALLWITADRLPPRNRARWQWRVAARIIVGALVVGFLVDVFLFGITHGQIHAKLRRAIESSIELWITSHPWLSVSLSLAVWVALYRLAMHQVERMEMPMNHPILDTEYGGGAGH